MSTNAWILVIDGIAQSSDSLEPGLFGLFPYFGTQHDVSIPAKLLQSSWKAQLVFETW